MVYCYMDVIYSTNLAIITHCLFINLIVLVSPASPLSPPILYFSNIDSPEGFESFIFLSLPDICIAVPSAHNTLPSFPS